MLTALLASVVSDKVVRYVSDWQRSSRTRISGQRSNRISKILKILKRSSLTPLSQRSASLWNGWRSRNDASAVETRLDLVVSICATCRERVLGGRSANADSCEEQSWPSIDSVLLVRDTIELAVQVNGKVRGTIMIARNASEEVALEAAKSQENVVKYIVGAKIKKVVYVSGKILNIVVE